MSPSSIRCVLNYIGAAFVTVLGPFFVSFGVAELTDAAAGPHALDSMSMAIAFLAIYYISSLAVGAMGLRYLVHQRRLRIVAVSLYVPAMSFILWIWSLELSCTVFNECM